MTIFQGVILNGTEVINAPTIVGNTAFQTNDQTITFGQPLAAASTRLSQDTTRAQLVLGLGTALGSQLVIGANAWIGRDFDHAAPANPTLFIHSATDPDVDNTQWISVTHNGTSGVITTGGGAIVLNTGWYSPVGCEVRDGRILFTSTAAGSDSYIAGYYLPTTSYGWYFGGNYTTVEAILAVGANCGNLLLFTNALNCTKDHDHALQVNPTLFIHSATDPDVNNTQWLSLTHNQTDAIITTGLGDVSFAPLTGRSLCTTYVAYNFTIKNLANAGEFGYINGEGFVLNLSGTGECVSIVKSVNRANDYLHAVPAVNPIFYVHSAIAAATATDQWVSTSHNQTAAVIATGKGDLILDPITEITEVCGVGLKTKEYNLTLNNGAKVNLPAGTGWGTFMIGDNQEYARIRWTAAAVVTLDEGTANVAIADTPAFFCLYDDVATVAIKNNLGVNLTLRYVIHYS
jgi:hypothetical protein